MAISYKHKCSRCKTNYVKVIWKQRYPVCYECQKRELDGEIKDPKMKKLFDIPEEYYKENAFLRDLKITYLQYRNLTDKQIQALKKTIQKIKEEKK